MATSFDLLLKANEWVEKNRVRVERCRSVNAVRDAMISDGIRIGWQGVNTVLKNNGFDMKPTLSKDSMQAQIDQLTRRVDNLALSVANMLDKLGTDE